MGLDTPLEWVDTGKDAYGMVVRIPKELRADPARRPSEHAWVIRFEWDRVDEFWRDAAYGVEAPSGRAARAAPQRAQFRQPGSTGWRHCGHATRTAVPQPAQ